MEGSSDEEETKSNDASCRSTSFSPHEDDGREPRATLEQTSVSAPCDKYGVPVNVVHSSQTKNAAWEHVHKLLSPQKSAGKMYTHVCLLCAAIIATKRGTPEAWRAALVSTSTTSNVKDHIKNKHKTHSYAVGLASVVVKKASKDTRAYDRSLEAAAAASAIDATTERSVTPTVGPADVATEMPRKRFKQSSMTEALCVGKDVAIQVATSRWLSRHGKYRLHQPDIPLFYEYTDK